MENNIARNILNKRSKLHVVSIVHAAGSALELRTYVDYVLETKIPYDSLISKNVSACSSKGVAINVQTLCFIFVYSAYIYISN